MRKEGPRFSQSLLAGAIIGLLLVVLLTGCATMQRPHAPAGRRSAAHLELEGDADPERRLRPAAEAPATFPQVTAPRSWSEPLSLPPNVVGRLDVPLGRKWDYIVVHHSFSNSGNAETFERCHKQRGWLGVGYHFVIGNGHGSGDGTVEVTFRWDQQLHGAHAGVKKYNEHGIGICLVGDFETGHPTSRQMASLVWLTNHLQEKCSIPTSGIYLHRHIKNTSCPGKNFPFYQYISMLNH